MAKKRQQTRAGDQETLQHVVETLLRMKRAPASIRVPVSIFATSLSPAEALVKHLKEQEYLTYAAIARLLNRDQRGIWCTYKRAVRKNAEPLVAQPSDHQIAASVFSDRTLSILEHVVRHLRRQNVAPKTIAALTKKHPSTIATVHSRAQRKLQ